MEYNGEVEDKILAESLAHAEMLRILGASFWLYCRGIGLSLSVQFIVIDLLVFQ
jgi:hypothetical protein